MSKARLKAAMRLNKVYAEPKKKQVNGETKVLYDLYMFR